MVRWRRSQSHQQGSFRLSSHLVIEVQGPQDQVMPGLASVSEAGQGKLGGGWLHATDGLWARREWPPRSEPWLRC